MLVWGSYDAKHSHGDDNGVWYRSSLGEKIKKVRGEKCDFNCWVYNTDGIVLIAVRTVWADKL